MSFWEFEPGFTVEFCTKIRALPRDASVNMRPLGAFVCGGSPPTGQLSGGRKEPAKAEESPPGPGDSQILMRD